MKYSTVLQALASALLIAALTAVQPALAAPAPAAAYRLMTISVVRAEPDGRIEAIWNAETTFTGQETGDEWIRVSGSFPGGKWQPLPHPLWISKYYAQKLDRAKPQPAHKDSRRYIVVNKNTFRLQVIERQAQKEQVLYETDVALGMDGCRPKSEGGQCYFTDPGEYHVRWKVHDPHGIEWCIPKYMETEYADDIAAGNRCFRGPLGYYALNIGKSYAIHGTNHPETIGQRVSHGCVRVVNSAMRRIFQLVGVGDKVIITE